MKNTLHFTFLRTLIVLAFGLFFNVAWGQTVNHTFSDTNGTIDDNISYTSQQNSSGTSPAISSGQLRLYYASNGNGNGGSITLSPSGGAIITQVKITAATTPTVKYNINGLGDLTASRSGSVYTISGISAETSLRIRNANTTNTQLRIESIEITYTIPVVAPPVVTPEAFVGTYNTSFSHQVVATGTPTSYQITSGTLPAGIVLDGVTGVLSGTPTVVGNFSVQIAATNGFGAGSATQIDFNIQKANQTVSIADQSVLLGTPAVSLPAATVEGLALNYTSSNSTVASISDISITYGQAGNSIVTATAAENEFYNSFTTTFNVAVVDPNAIPCFSEDFSSLITGSNTSSSQGGALTVENNATQFTGFSQAYPANNAIKLGSGSAVGYVEKSNLELVGNVKVNFLAKGWYTSSGYSGAKLEITIGSVTQIIDVPARTLMENWQEFEFVLNNIVSGASFRIATGVQGGERRAFVDNISICPIPAPTSTTWNGTAWSNGTPTSALDAIIAGNYSTGAVAPQGPFTAKSLTVNSGIFTVASGTSVTVENAVTNSAGAANFIVENNANLIQTATVTNSGAITVLRNSAPIVRLDHTLWSSPVASQNLYAFSPNTLTNRFYVYNTPTDTYVTTGLSATSTFVPGKGYGVRAPNNYQTAPALAWNGTFAGVPNNGDVPFAVSTAGTGFNLVGNPYPSTISATAFINANPSLNGTLYFYAHSLAMDANGNFPAGTNYATWNLTGSTVATTTATNSGVVPNGTIQVGQGFIVKATGTGAVTFANAMRTADTNNQFFRTANQFAADSEVEKHRLWLDLTNPEGTAFNQILIGYVAGATEGFDRGYDGLAFGNTGSYISTKIADSEYAIQARSLPFQASDVVPVSFKAETAGSYTISLSNRDGLFSGEQTVFLKDNSNNTLNNLKSGPYTFSATAGTFNNRFEVVYDSALGVAETTFNSNSIVAFKKNNILNVESKNNEIASITAYDVQGRLIYTKSNINTNAIELSDLRVQNGVLLLQVTSVEGLAATIKVIY